MLRDDRQHPVAKGGLSSRCDVQGWRGKSGCVKQASTYAPSHALPETPKKTPRPESRPFPGLQAWLGAPRARSSPGPPFLAGLFAIVAELGVVGRWTVDRSALGPGPGGVEHRSAGRKRPPAAPRRPVASNSTPARRRRCVLSIERADIPCRTLGGEPRAFRGVEHA